MPQAVDSSQGTSAADLKKQIQEQTQAMLDAVASPTAIPGDVVVDKEETQTEETEATEQAEERATEETETSEEATSEETTEETPKKKTETLYKLKVEGKEEEWPLEKVIAFAQQGRFLEKDKQRLNEERRQLEEERKKTATPSVPTKEQMDAEFNKLVEQNGPGMAVMMTAANAYQALKAMEQDQRKADRAFEKERENADPDIWKIIKPIYEGYRDEGQSREMAYMMAENEMLRKALTTAKDKGLKEGVNKEKNKQKAVIPTAQTRTAAKTKAASPEELKKMKASEMRKHLPRSEAPPGW